MKAAAAIGQGILHFFRVHAQLNREIGRVVDAEMPPPLLKDKGGGHAPLAQKADHGRFARVKKELCRRTVHACDLALLVFDLQLVALVGDRAIGRQRGGFFRDVLLGQRLGGIGLVAVLHHL